jgi:hypothetical protein
MGELIELILEAGRASDIPLHVWLVKTKLHPALQQTVRKIHLQATYTQSH